MKSSPDIEGRRGPLLFITRRLRSAHLAILLLSIATVVYWPGLGGGFLFDDVPNIVANPRVHATELSAESLSKAAQGYEPGGYGRPLATITFAINYYLGQDDPFGYKVTNLVVHLVNALLIFLLTRTLLVRGPEQAPLGPAAAFVVTAAWAVHPLQVSSVLYVVQRMETLSLSFVLLGMLAYCRGRHLQIAGANGWPWLASSVIIAAVGVLSKESAALFPVYTLALELTVLGFAAKVPSTARALRVIYSVGASVAIGIFLLWVLPHYVGAYGGREFTAGQRLLTQLPVLAMYLSQMLLPRPGGMTFYYDDFPISQGLLDPPTTLLAGILLMALLGSAVALRKRMPLYALGIFWFFAGHLLTSNVIPLELVYEHRNYFALLGICLALAGLILRAPALLGAAGLRYAAAALLAGLSVFTLIRSATWGDPLLLARTLAETNPRSLRASTDLATLYAARADGDADSPFQSLAMAEYSRGAALSDPSVLPVLGLILTAARAGQEVKDEWWTGLMERMAAKRMVLQEQEAVALLPLYRYEFQIDDRRVADAYERLTSLYTLRPHVLATFGDHAINHLKDRDLANRMFMAAVDRSRNDPKFIDHMVVTLAGEGHQEQALRVLERASELGIADGGSLRLSPSE